MITSEDILRLRELLSFATPGPWEAGTATCCPDMGYIDGPVGKSRVCPVYESTKTTHTMGAEDAELIVTAINALPALLNRLEALERVQLAARDLCSWQLGALLGDHADSDSVCDDKSRLEDAIDALDVVKL